MGTKTKTRWLDDEAGCHPQERVVNEISGKVAGFTLAIMRATAALDAITDQWDEAVSLKPWDEAAAVKRYKLRARQLAEYERTRGKK